MAIPVVRWDRTRLTDRLAPKSAALHAETRTKRSPSGLGGQRGQARFDAANADLQIHAATIGNFHSSCSNLGSGPAGPACAAPPPRSRLAKPPFGRSKITANPRQNR